MAQRAQLLPIVDVATEVGLEPDELELYGRFKAKVDLSALVRRRTALQGKLVCVTAITPTRAGEGKTTTAIALTQALGWTGRRALACLREPSLGPVFGLKGGGAGGGRAQIAPMEDVNLHFTGDIHAIGAANNLLAAMIDAHLLHGNELGIDPGSITWRRCLDMDDRGLRVVDVGLGGPANGSPHRTGFDITAASEVMAIVSVARGLTDLRKRLGEITVASTGDGEPVTAEQVGAPGAMAALLRDALKPNLVQTLEGQPALVHCGPFANIAHGNNSLIADLLGLQLADYVVTESGFGSDMGFEKLLDIVIRQGAVAPAAVVLVVTTQALKHHGGDPNGRLEALERGSDNLAAHLRIVRQFGLEAVVAVNRFPGDSAVELDATRRLALDLGALAAEINDGFEQGGAGAVRLAEAVVDASARPVPYRPLYDLEDSIESKLDAVATRVYGADGIELSTEAKSQLAVLEDRGLARLPVCVAKTHLSLSHDPLLTGAPSGFVLPIRELRPYTGAGWIVALCRQMQTMPGLSAHPAALDIDLDADGRIVGLF